MSPMLRPVARISAKRDGRSIGRNEARASDCQSALVPGGAPMDDGIGGE
jgi:hypothetical protein